MSIMIGAIVPLLVVLGILQFLFKSGGYGDIVGGAFFLILLLMGGMLVIMNMATSMNTSLSIKEFGGLAILMIAFSVSMSMMTMS